MEALLRASFAIYAWARERGANFSANTVIEHPASIDEFRTLSRLYFPELQDETDQISILFSNCIQKFGDIRGQLLLLDREDAIARSVMNIDAIASIKGLRSGYLISQAQPVANLIGDVGIATHKLGDRAQIIMGQLITAPSNN
ncbi:hypothetical protein RCH14_000144 [Massilia sp. MP_M2]|uniref:hypothetical protein n=1 Tax=Massilia sp. MP_M2 TaxID=3071713 RepID=UPI00319E0AB1